MSDTRKDTLECNILKEVRNQLISLGRWTKSNLLTANVEGEHQRYNYETEQWSWQAWEDDEFSLDSNSKVMEFGKLLVEDPSTPQEALSSLRLPDDEDGDAIIRKIKPADIEVCTVGAIYMAAGMNGVDDSWKTELIQVMVATGRAVKNHMRSLVPDLQLLTSSQLDMTLPYNANGMAEAEGVIISFNDNEETTADDIEKVLAMADIELACVRGEVPA